MIPMARVAERLGDRHYAGRMDRSRGCAFRVEPSRLEERRRAYGGNFCVILWGEARDDYFVIPYQILAPTLAEVSATRPVGADACYAWVGTIAGDTTLAIEGSRFDVQVGSYYRKADLLDWLIEGNDLFSFNHHRADEAASGWTPYGPPTTADAEKLKVLLDGEGRIPGRSGSARPGQAEFRESLRQRYGDRCMISRCPLLQIVEAAHIVPYRMTSDHHPANGLLLRADLHALFDLHLLGIDPESLTVAVHPEARRAGYADLDGLNLQILTELRPSRDALLLRWKWFRERLETPGRPPGFVASASPQRME